MPLCRVCWVSVWARDHISYLTDSLWGEGAGIGEKGSRWTWGRHEPELWAWFGVEFVVSVESGPQAVASLEMGKQWECFSLHLNVESYYQVLWRRLRETLGKQLSDRRHQGPDVQRKDTLIGLASFLLQMFPLKFLESGCCWKLCYDLTCFRSSRKNRAQASCLSLTPKQCFSTEGQFCLPRAIDNVWRHFWFSYLRWVLLSSSE